MKLASGLTADGFTPWLCEMSIAPAANWVQEIESGLRAADLVLLLWSPEAAQSAATKAEWASAWVREITERRLRLGVVMVRQHDLPELIRTKQYIDATQNEERGIGRVLQWLKDRRYLGRAAGKAAPIFLPDYRPQNFVGRQEHIQKLTASLIDRQGVFLLNGEPGSGKSTLALMFAWEAQKDFDAVLFQTCGRRSTDTIAGEIAEQLKGQLGEGILQLAPENKLTLIKDWLRQRETLLVLDDVWLASGGSGEEMSQSASSLRKLLPGPPVSVLFTSRLRLLPGLLHNQILPVEAFTEAEAEKVFISYLGSETVERHREALLEFAHRVERLPIAIAVGAELLRSQFGPLSDAARTLSLKNLRDEIGEIHDVPGLFQKAIEAQGKNEQKLLQAASVCSPDGFWLPLAAFVADLNQEQAAAARDRLVNASLLRLLDRERQRFQLHSLLREQILAGVPLLTELQETHVNVLENIFKDWQSRWSDCSECMQEINPAVAFLWNRDNKRAKQLLFFQHECAKIIRDLETEIVVKQQADRIQQEIIMAVYKQQEAICQQLGNKSLLGYCYWSWGILARQQGQRGIEVERLRSALAIFTDLNMFQERDAVQKELDKKNTEEHSE